MNNIQNYGIANYQSPNFGAMKIKKPYVKPIIAKANIEPKKDLCSNWFEKTFSSPKHEEYKPSKPTVEVWYDDENLERYRRLGYTVIVKH